MNYVDHVIDQNNVVHTLVDPGGRDMQKVAGAYNLLNNTAVSAVISPVTWTVNADKTVTATVSETLSSANYLFVCSTNTNTFVPIDTGGVDLKLLGSPVASGVGIYAYYKTSESGAAIQLEDIGNGVIIPASAKYINVYCRFGTATQQGTYTFKPMITPDLTATYDDYVPYCMSNRELMEDLFVDPTAVTTVKYATDFTESAEFTITQDGLYYVYLQQNAADTGSVLFIYKNNTSDGTNNLAIKRTVGVMYDSINIIVPIKAGTKLIFACNNSNLQCQYKVIRHSA